MYQITRFKRKKWQICKLRKLNVLFKVENRLPRKYIFHIKFKVFFEISDEYINRLI